MSGGTVVEGVHNPPTCWKMWIACLFVAALSAACSRTTGQDQPPAPRSTTDERPVCIGPFTCDGAANMCRVAIPGAVVGSFTFTDSGYTGRSDGRGPSVHGVDGAVAVATVAIVLAWRRPPVTTSYNLVHNRPVIALVRAQPSLVTEPRRRGFPGSGRLGG
jgi:hypothetical protein